MSGGTPDLVASPRNVAKVIRKTGGAQSDEGVTVLTPKRSMGPTHPGSSSVHLVSPPEPFNSPERPLIQAAGLTLHSKREA